jgi:hypothetical protein
MQKDWECDSSGGELEWKPQHSIRGKKKKKFTFLIIKELMQIKSSVAETEIQYRVKIKLRKSQEK